MPNRRCESCGAPADVLLDDGSTWCLSCDTAARTNGYDNRPAVTARHCDEECVFVEEQEPSGRLILPPCIICGYTAMGALNDLRIGRDTPT